MKHDQWMAAAVICVLEPANYKSGAAAIISECPQCFEKSWVHIDYSSFFCFDNVWPPEWEKAADKKDESDKVEALRKWGASLCWRCKHLTRAKVDNHTSRSCIRGSGQAEAECHKFELLKQ